MQRRRGSLALSIAGSIAISIVLGALPLAVRAASFTATNLVTDDPAVNAAPLTDPQLVNPWGVAHGPTTPFWVSDNETGAATIYTVDPATNATTKNGLVVAIPGAGDVTGQVFNPESGSFAGDAFLFASEDGTISGWQPMLGANAAVRVSPIGQSYKGITLGGTGDAARLYAANFASGTIDAFDGDFAPVLPGGFTDPNLPAGYAPFNVQQLGGTVFVTYAVVGANGDDVAGAGNGIVDAFDPAGNLLRRVATGGDLDSPWGLAIAPASFGELAGSLLVGNFGDGRIHAFDPSNGTPLGALVDALGDPLAIEGLWALAPGNGAGAGSADSIYFTAGPQDETHGLFGVIAVVPEPGTDLLLSSGLLLIGWRARRAA